MLKRYNKNSSLYCHEESSTMNNKQTVDFTTEQPTTLKGDDTGLDMSLVHMNITELYALLLTRFNGDKSQVRTWFHEAGFKCNFSLWNRDSEISDEYKANMKTWAKVLHDRGIIKSSDVDITTLETSFVVIRYHELHGNRFWRYRWAKQCRGIVLFVNPITGEVTNMSYKLPRGAEVMTGMHKASGIDDTQDVKNGSVKILDDEQIDTCVRLIENRTINGCLSSKGDGSLFSATLHSGKALDVMLSAVEVFGTPYVKLWTKMSMKLSNNKTLIVPATQGTLWEGGFMQGYMVTSILVGDSHASREVLINEEADGMTSVQAFEKYGINFIKKLLTLPKKADINALVVTVSFEAMCKNRTGLFDFNQHGERRVHEELAISYPRDRLIMLGISDVDNLYYKPHFTIKDVPFEEPLWWNIEHAQKVWLMMGDMELVLRAKITKSQYLIKWPPSNNSFDTTNEKMVSDAILDFQGWVFMKAIASTNNTISWIYSKIKLVAYYKTHKFHTKNLDFLFTLAQTSGDNFPMACKVRSMLSGTFVLRMSAAVQRVLGLVDLETFEGQQFLEQVRTGYRATVEAVKLKNSSGGKKIKTPKDPTANLEKRTKDVRCRIIVNTRSIDFGAACIAPFEEEFHEMDVNAKDLSTSLRGIINDLQPWKAGLDERIAALSPHQKSLQGFISACLDFSIG